MNEAVIKDHLIKNYSIYPHSIKSIAAGVGGDTFVIETEKGKYIFKIADSNEINRPEEETKLCKYLCQNGIEAIHFIKDNSGKLNGLCEGRCCHLYAYVEGEVLKMNTAPESVF